MCLFRILLEQEDAENESKALRVPLHAIVDYAGFRLVATPLIPIRPSNHSQHSRQGREAHTSLIYGSDDGGRTIVNLDKQFDSLLATAASQLHLAPHQVFSHKLCTAGDVEGQLDLFPYC